MVATLIEHRENKSQGRSKSPFYLNTVNSVLLKTNYNAYTIGESCDPQLQSDVKKYLAVKAV
jgi:hypothetical protein